MIELVGMDVYLRYGRGPVQHFRAWDVKKFLDARIQEGLGHKDGPVVVSVATVEQYRAERQAKRQ